MNLAPAAFALALFVPGAARAQDQEAMKKKLEEKLESEFLKNAAWVTDFDQAKAESKKSGKPIFAYFTRSYAN